MGILLWMCLCVLCRKGMGNWDEGLGRDVQSVLRELVEKVEKQQETISLLTQMLKKTDGKVENIMSEMVNHRTVENQKFARLEEKMAQQGKVVRSNENSLKVVEKRVTEQNQEVQKMKNQLSEEVEEVHQVEQEVKNVKDQLNHLVLDTKILLFYNKVNSTSKLNQVGNDSTSMLGSTQNQELEKNQMWRLELDPSGSGCYRIFNLHYVKWRITLWSSFLGVFPGDYYPDQLWRFQYIGKGYYYIVNCYYTDKRIHLEADGTLVGKSGKYEEKQLWKLVPVKHQDLLENAANNITAMKISVDNNIGLITTLENHQVKQNETLSVLSNKLLNDEGRIENNKDFVNAIKKDIAAKSIEFTAFKKEISKQKANSDRTQDEIREITDQVKHLVFDAKIVLIYNKVNITSKLYQFGEFSTKLGSTDKAIVEQSHMWRLELDPSGSGCYRIFNLHYLKWRITLWGSVLEVYSGDYYVDQLWRFQYNGNGYYFIVNCAYTDKRIHLEEDGTPVGMNGEYQERQLWKLVSVKEDDLLKKMKDRIEDSKIAIEDNRGLVKQIENHQLAANAKLIVMNKTLSQNEEKVDRNTAFIKKIEKDQENQHIESKKIKEELLKEQESIQHTQDDVRDIDEQIKHLVYDAKIVLIYNKVNSTAKLYQFGEFSTKLGSTDKAIVERSHMWRLELDPSGSGCYRIFNLHYLKWRITLWGSVLEVYPGDYYADQLWRFQYNGNGYYYIVNCAYTDKRIHLEEDGTPVAKGGVYKKSQLWKLVPVLPST